MNLDLGYAIEQEDMAGNDLLIVAGDNLFEFRRGFQGDSPPDDIVFDGAWYDIGSFESYDQANEDYKGRVHNIVLQSGRLADSIIGRGSEPALGITGSG